jgi:2-dehydro-3-deoxyphosphogluconate aldolase / (4S)-4-hydroxy-2-oxoglutarate aldolase
MPVIGILRGCPLQYVDDMATAAEVAGLTALEVTLDSMRPFEAIRVLTENHPKMSVGAGTVRSVLEVEQAVEAGARFIVSPHLDPEVVVAASRTGVVSVPGAATPTEVWRAANSGAGLVKLFPARELGGPEFVKAIRGPLGEPALVPTGGVEASNAAAFLEAGATALGVGGAVFPRTALEAGDVVEVERRARTLIATIKRFLENSSPSHEPDRRATTG